MARDPLSLSDIVKARDFLRRETYVPGIFKGEVHCVTSDEVHSAHPDDGWKTVVEGKLIFHQADVSMGGRSESIARLVRSYVIGES